MTTNQTIDGVPRELLENCASYMEGSASGTVRIWHDRLRALLDAPSTEPSIPQNFVEACDKFDWTPGEALRFYAEGKHFDTDQGRTRILCTGAIASHALKGMGEGYASMKGFERAAQPQGEPVAIVDSVVRNIGEWCVTFDAAVRVIDASVLTAGQLLYAEQPAPVAVVLAEAREWLGDGKHSDGLHREHWTPEYADLIDRIDATLRT